MDAREQFMAAPNEHSYDRVAEEASARYGWPLHVIEDAADDPPIEQPEAFLRALHTALETATAREPAR
jgi:hypothetical protein